MLPERLPFSYLSEAPGAQSPGTACTLPGTISPPLALRGTARVSCLRLLARSLQDTPKGEIHDEYAWKTSLSIVGGIVHVETGTVTDSGPRHTPGLVDEQENQKHLVSHHHLPERNITLLWGSLPESFWGSDTTSDHPEMGQEYIKSPRRVGSQYYQVWDLHSKGAQFSLITSESRKTASPIWPEGFKAKMRVPLNDWILTSQISPLLAGQCFGV